MTKGIHHITAIASNAQKTVDFYTKILGLRLVKKSVNQDDTQTYHLFFGDRLGDPGMDLTFFIFLPAMQGVQGSGMVSKISLAAPEDSLEFWQKRFEEHGIEHHAPVTQFGHDRIIFFDADSQQLELVGANKDSLEDTGEVWTTKDISDREAIRQFHSATLTVANLASVAPVLTEVFGYEHLDQDKNRHLFRTFSKRASILEVNEDPSLQPGIGAAGTVHHIAFRARDEKHQLELREKVIEIGLYPTEVINRYYFKSVYFRTPAGILFEIATDGPGFTTDQKESQLGTVLSLPPFLESERDSIEANLEPISYEV